MFIIDKNGKIVKRSRSTFSRQVKKQFKIAKSVRVGDLFAENMQNDNVDEMEFENIDNSDNIGRESEEEIESNVPSSTENNPILGDANNTEEKCRETSLTDELRFWAVNHRITMRALNDLLKILIAFGIVFLPKNCKTLLKTPRNVSIVELAGGMFWYNGVKNSISHMFRNLNRNMSISLNINVDGLPLFKSARKFFWPILANCHSKNFQSLLKKKLCNIILFNIF